MSVHAKDLQCLKLNENQTENARYLPRNLVFTFCKMCKELYGFRCTCIKSLQKVLLWPYKKFLQKLNLGTKTRRILCWFGIRWCQLTKMLVKKLYAKFFANFEYFLHLLQSIYAFNFFLQLFLKLLSTKKISIYSNSAFVNILIHFFTILQLTLALLRKNSTLQKFTLFCQDLAFSMWFLQKFQKVQNWSLLTS